MNKRQFLKVGIALAGVAGLSRIVLSQSRAESADPGEFEITKTEAEWRSLLTPQQFSVLRHQSTEAPYSSPLASEHAAGIYSCAGCDLPLFSSETKFESGTGWPSFYAPIQGAIATTTDHSFLMTRTEVHCRRCGGHQGHVFGDGPQPTGKRYCINGVALTFTAGPVAS